MTTLELILSIITGLSTLGNLTQWVNLRALKDKARYEADDTHIESLNKTIVALQGENARLSERVKTLEDKLVERDRAFEERERMFEERIEMLEKELRKKTSKTK